MEKALSYILTPVFYLLFLLTLVFFHGVQWVAFNVFGYQAHKNSVSILNWFLMRTSQVLGTTYRYVNPRHLPEDRPIILVSNHQSMYDIPPIIWYFRKYHPKFVSKKELGKGIPSVSYNLRHGGSVLIDRKNTEQSLDAIRSLGNYISQYNRTAVIFPEGTRSKDGTPKPFKKAGLKALFESAPDALVVPMTIIDSWKLHKFGGSFPLGLGVRIQHVVHEPMSIEGDTDELILRLEKIINGEISRNGHAGTTAERADGKDANPST
jgi:1-acyl-sn-glycerol-3-phosphate acyltransferase